MFKQENTDVVDRFLNNHKDFDLDDLGPIKEFLGIGDKGLVKILPDRYEMDGFFISRMKKI